jgi:hypothetical protein
MLLAFGSLFLLAFCNRIEWWKCKKCIARVRLVGFWTIAIEGATSE